MTALTVVRTALLAAAILQGLLSTIAFRRVQLPLVARFWGAMDRATARHGATSVTPTFLRDSRMVRVAGLASAVFFFLLWWALGTEAGAQWFTDGWQS